VELIARLDGAEETVQLERHGDVYRLRIGERAYEVDVARFGASGRSLLIAGVQHEVVVKPLGRGRYQVASAHGLEEVEMVDPLTHLARRTRADGGGEGARVTTAYMPGRVVTLLVGAGDEVAAGQGVLVLEAMKMENEIRTEQAGVIARFFVEPGQAVESGDPLFEVE
jgi:biotin carboxyl carrier protein